jgi:hypothetical protein
MIEGARKALRIALLPVAMAASATMLSDAAAAPDRAMAACRSAKPQISIKGCTIVIERPRSSRRDRAIAHYNRGNAFASQGEDDRAIADYTESIKFNPSFAFAWFNRQPRQQPLQQWPSRSGDRRLHGGAQDQSEICPRLYQSRQCLSRSEGLRASLARL